MKRKIEIRVAIAGMRPSRPIKVPASVPAEIVAEALRDEIVRRTPVDTGKARRGWRVVELAGGNIRVSNRVDYVQYLEDGSSKQAPRGFQSQSITAARAFMREGRNIAEGEGIVVAGE